MASIPLQRSKAYLEKRGWHVAVVEHWNPHAFIRQDAFGFLDLISVRHDSPGVWGCNPCGEDTQKHVDKYLNGGCNAKGKPFPPNPHLPVWLSAGNRFSIFGWVKRSSDGRGSRKVWTLRMTEAYLDGAEVKFKEVTDPVEVS